MSALNFSEKKEEEDDESQQDITQSGVTRLLQTRDLQPNAILSRVTTNMLTLAAKNILE